MSCAGLPVEMALSYSLCREGFSVQRPVPHSTRAPIEIAESAAVPPSARCRIRSYKQLRRRGPPNLFRVGRQSASRRSKGATSSLNGALKAP